MTVPHENLKWRKSSFSTHNNCVEVAPTADGGMMVRNSKRPEETPISYTASEWRAFVAGVKNGEFDL